VKILRFIDDKNTSWGALDEDELSINTLNTPPFEKINPSKKSIPLKSVKLLPPTIPSKVILVGLNYIDHAKELNMPIPKNPIIFLKPPTSILANGEPIIYPNEAERLDYEAELAVVIRKAARKIPEAQVKDYILGYTCLNDVTARDIQKKDTQWTRAKSFDTFCPIGPWISTDINPDKVNVKSYLNGKIKQASCTSNFIFKIRHLVSFISGIMTLNPGDVISTGTPPGVGPMKRGDTIEIEIEGIGRLKNIISSEKELTRR